MGLFDNFSVILFKEELHKKLHNFLKIKIDIYFFGLIQKISRLHMAKSIKLSAKITAKYRF